MIQITNSNIAQGDTLENLADKHFKYFNQKCKTGKREGEFKKNSLTYKIENALSNSTTSLENTFYLFLKNNLHDIITGKPSVLQSFVNTFYSNFPTDFFVKYDTTKEKHIETKIGKTTKSIFNYTNFRQSKYCCDLLTKVGFSGRKPCPYCNFDEISIISFENINQDTIDKALLDIDHFIPQSKYPFLALSFYNLIPSCHNCNSVFKGDDLYSIHSHVNPFDKDFDDIFLFELTNPFSTSLEISDFDFKVSNKQTFPSDIITDLKILERYRSEKENVFEDLKIIVNNTQNRRDEICDIFNEDTINDEIFVLAKIPKTKENISKYKLGKLKRDICMDNGIL